MNTIEILLPSLTLDQLAKFNPQALIQEVTSAGSSILGVTLLLFLFIVVVINYITLWSSRLIGFFLNAVGTT